MGWISTVTGPLLNLDKVHYLDVEGSGSSWSIVAYMDTGVVNSRTDGSATTLTVSDFSTQADAIAALGNLIAYGSASWLLVSAPLAEGGLLLNVSKVYQFVVGGSGTTWYLEACLDEGTASGTGNDVSAPAVVTPGGTYFTTEAGADAALAVLFQQLAVVNG